jgi:hypothetical protein
VVFYTKVQSFLSSKIRNTNIIKPKKVNFDDIKSFNMRLVIEFDEQYKNLFYEIAQVAKATIIEEEPELWMELPEHVRAGVEKSLEQVRNGQAKSYKEVKKILANR